MASYFSSILTSTTSRVATLSSKFLASENDGDTEDDTHLCRVLRAYYTEKGRSFPAWLPPDPKAPPPPPVIQPVYASSIGSRYGAMNSGGQEGGGRAGGNKMASLWDRGGDQQQAPVQHESLRAGRGAAQPQQRLNPFTRSQTPQAQSTVESRPLPSQRAGSYQTSIGRDQSMTPPGSASGMSAKDRLRRGIGQVRGGRAGGSDERASSMGSQGSGASDRPLMSANSPWAADEQLYGSDGAGGGYDSGAARRTQGLPSGPGAGRRGPGLPSGPRGVR